MYKPCRARILLCGIALLYAVSSAFGQAPTDSLANRQALSAVVDHFNHAIGKQSWIYQGVGYDLYPRTIKGSPYFKDSLVMYSGTIVYDGYRYKNVPLLYDLNADLLISTFNDGFSRYSFLKDKVNEFEIYGHHFVRMEPDSAAKKALKPGYYDVLYDGQLQALGRYTRNIQVQTNMQGPEQTFESSYHYYLRKNGVYYYADSQGALMALLKDHKKELKKYLKDHELNYRKQTETAIAQLAAYYDQLTH